MDTRVYRRPLATCAVPDCFFRVSNGTSYYDHLIDKHAFPVDMITKTYAFDYFIIDTKTDHNKFAHICYLCAKHVGTELHFSFDLTTTREEELHVSDHTGIISYHCTDCSTWFKTQLEVERHSLTNHGRRNRTQTVLEYFSDNDGLYLMWQTALFKMTGNVNLNFVSHCPIPEIEVNFVVSNQSAVERKENEDEDVNVSHILKLNEGKWHSVYELKGLMKKFLIVCGDWQQLFKIIQSSSAANIKSACTEIKEDLFELVTHNRAFHSTSILFLMCDDQSWQFLMDMLKHDQIRAQLYDSFEAGNFFRKIMSVETFSEQRYQNLSIAFDISEFENKKANFIFFSCIALRPGRAAQSLALYATSKIPYMGTDQQLYRCLCILIKTASLEWKRHSDVVYKNFLQAVSTAYHFLIASKFGILVLQAQTYFSPQFCCNFIDRIISYDWMFDVIENSYRFKDSNQSHLIQVAICASKPEEICRLVSLFFEKSEPDPFFLLLKDRVGNNILRRIVGQIGDPSVLNRIAKHLSVLLEDIKIVNRNRPKNIKFAKVVVDLASRRSKMAMEKFYHVQ